MSRKDSRRAQRGFTFIEIAITSVVVLMILASSTRLFGTTTELTRESHAHTRAHAEHRRSLIFITGILRTVAEYTLTGFDANGFASTIDFERITGVGVHDHIYRDPERIEWRASTDSVPGISNPGDVWLVDTATNEATLLAANVPQGGFQIRREGNVLAVRMTTYYMASNQHVATVTSESAAYIRN